MPVSRFYSPADLTYQGPRSPSFASDSGFSTETENHDQAGGYNVHESLLYASDAQRNKVLEIRGELLGAELKIVKVDSNNDLSPR